MFRIHGILVWIRIRGSMPLTNGSGFGSGSWIRILLFSSLNFKMLAKNLIFLQKFFCLLLFEGTFTLFYLNIKSQKVSQNRRIQDFSYYFCMIEGSGSGSIPLTSGSGSGRPKTPLIRWIRIRNTDLEVWWQTYFSLEIYCMIQRHLSAVLVNFMGKISI